MSVCLLCAVHVLWSVKITNICVEDTHLCGISFKVCFNPSEWPYDSQNDPTHKMPIIWGKDNNVQNRILNMETIQSIPCKVQLLSQIYVLHNFHQRYVT